MNVRTQKMTKTLEKELLLFINNWLLRGNYPIFKESTCIYFATYLGGLENHILQNSLCICRLAIHGLVINSNIF